VVAAIPKTQCTQVLFRSLACQPAAESVVASLIQHNVVHALPQIQVDFLRHEADARLGRLQLGSDIVAEDLDFTAGLVNQGADNANRRRFTGAIRAKKRIKVAGLNGEVDSLERLVAIGIGLGQVFDGQCLHAAGYCNHACRRRSVLSVGHS